MRHTASTALQIDGNPKVLPDVLSPQLSDWFWLPHKLRAPNALMADDQPSDVAGMCRSPRVIAHLTVPYHVVNFEQGAPITFCQLKAPIPHLWGGLRNVSCEVPPATTSGQTW